MLKEHIRKGINILSNPEKAFGELEVKSLEEIVSYYMLLLIATSAAAGVASFLFFAAKALYFDIFFRVEVVYSTMLNYLIGRSILLGMLYVFFGTFMLFFISVALKIFFLKIRYVNLLKILLVSLTPLLLFAWVPAAQFPLVIWSVFLFLTGVKSHKSVKIKKGSIKQRY